ncbi:MAG: TetR/AcrR family transcriptional regulator [Oscillospiraceae bacterium]|nr:TetR/AcrR family transcriptional regulator [Oscillospiraceae bacterium]
MSLQDHHSPTFGHLPTEKQLRIFRAAAEEFALRGFDSAKMNTIAYGADVSVGSLYQYFENKQALYLAVIHNSIAEMEELLDTLLHTDADILLKAERILREIQRFSRKERLLIKLYQGATAQNDPHLAAQLAAEIESVTARIYRQAIQEAQAAGEIRRDIDADFAAYMLNSFFMALQFSYSCEYHAERLRIYAGTSALERDDFVVEQVLNFFKSALR